jgi:hypothetical protein
VVYKPRPLTAHRHLNELVGWFNGQPDVPELRTVALLDRPGYGWLAYVAALPCRDRGQLERFYRRQGAWLALLHALDATDLHFVPGGAGPGDIAEESAPVAEAAAATGQRDLGETESDIPSNAVTEWPVGRHLSFPYSLPLVNPPFCRRGYGATRPARSFTFGSQLTSVLRNH